MYAFSLGGGSALRGDELVYPSARETRAPGDN